MDLNGINLSEIDLTNVDEQLNLVLDIATQAMVGYGFNVIGALIVLAIGWWFAGFAKNLVTKGLSRFKNADATLIYFASSVVRYGILIVTIIAVLDRFGVETTSLIAVLGAAGLAIGLALQGTLSNVAAGVMLLIFRPYRIGHFVDIGGQMGTVKNQGLFVTELSMVDNIKIMIPNSDIWGSPITNYSAIDTRRMDVDIGIGYGEDINAAFKALSGVIERDPRVLKDPAPSVFVKSLGDSSVNLTARLWTNTSDFWTVRWDMNKGLKEALDKAGIEIPFPQRSVHIVQPKKDGVQKKATRKKVAKKKKA